MKCLFKAYHTNIMSCPVDSNGLQVERLDKLANKKPKIIYTTPTHQYPLGSIMPISRRLRLLEWAQQQGAYIIEDDYDSEFHYNSRPLPSLQGLDDSQRVLYVGSFSKVLLPTLRMGYLIVPENLVSLFSKVKQITFSNTEPVKQAVVAEFIQQGHFGRHLKRMRMLYKDRMQHIIDEANKKLQQWFEVVDYGAGMHLVLILKQGVDDIALADKLSSKGLGCKALSEYYISKTKKQGLILGFSNADKQMITKGIEIVQRLSSYCIH